MTQNLHLLLELGTHSTDPKAHDAEMSERLKYGLAYRQV